MAGQSDADNFTQTLDSMTIMGFTKEEAVGERNGERGGWRDESRGRRESVSEEKNSDSREGCLVDQRSLQSTECTAE